MTYSIVARCPRTGQLGIGVASYSMAIGLYCDGAVRANTGVTLTQGFPNPRNIISRSTCSHWGAPPGRR